METQIKKQKHFILLNCASFFGLIMLVVSLFTDRIDGGEFWIFAIGMTVSGFFSLLQVITLTWLYTRDKYLDRFNKTILIYSVLILIYTIIINQS
jgi:hypothetical protein